MYCRRLTWLLLCGFLHACIIREGDILIGSIGVALGHTAVVMLICRHGVLTPLRRTLAAVGRMAFSSCITQNLICALLFYGWGFTL